MVHKLIIENNYFRRKYKAGSASTIYPRVNVVFLLAGLIAKTDNVLIVTSTGYVTWSFSDLLFHDVINEHYKEQVTSVCEVYFDDYNHELLKYDYKPESYYLISPKEVISELTDYAKRNQTAP